MNSEVLNDDLEEYKRKQVKDLYRICPRCGKPMSRGLLYNPKDKKSDLYLCPPCGVEQGLELAGKTKTIIEIPDYWFYNNDEWKEK